ncbi:hypothetical protein C7212DRAFT_342272 [Tuber magnatum]|uniref:Uncharacterized protein n=1 Tax=Tuber magnatum TaxID=42249 RepID=A0A317SSF4_9PEZI|nr:hypothetical protein C7212DRAFT_342272 [Tuber magnatum]
MSSNVYRTPINSTSVIDRLPSNDLLLPPTRIPSFRITYAAPYDAAPFDPSVKATRPPPFPIFLHCALVTSQVREHSTIGILSISTSDCTITAPLSSSPQSQYAAPNQGMFPPYCYSVIRAWHRRLTYDPLTRTMAIPSSIDRTTLGAFSGVLNNDLNVSLTSHCMALIILS